MESTIIKDLNEEELVSVSSSISKIKKFSLYLNESGLSFFFDQHSSAFTWRRWRDGGLFVQLLTSQLVEMADR